VVVTDITHHSSTPCAGCVKEASVTVDVHPDTHGACEPKHTLLTSYARTRVPLVMSISLNTLWMLTSEFVHQLPRLPDVLPCGRFGESILCCLRLLCCSAPTRHAPSTSDFSSPGCCRYSLQSPELMVSATKFDHSAFIQVRLLTFTYNAHNIHVDSPLCSREVCGPEINTPFHACFICHNVPMGDTTINFTAVENGEF
jgi:hypothetical protein